MVDGCIPYGIKQPQIHEIRRKRSDEADETGRRLLLALVLVLSMAAGGKKDGDGGDSQLASSVARLKTAFTPTLSWASAAS